jgi:hypothetical protein
MKKKSTIKDKLFNYEEEPPPHIWPAVVSSLPDRQQHSLKDRLSQYEEAPPAHVWNNIANQLTATPLTIPIYQRHAALFKYIAVAVLIILLAISIVLLIEDKKLPKANAGKAIVHPHKKISDSPGTPIQLQQHTN